MRVWGTCCLDHGWLRLHPGPVLKYLSHVVPQLKLLLPPSQFGFSRIFIAEKEYSVPFFRGLALQNAKLVSVLLLKFRRPSALYYPVEFSNIKTQKKYWMFHFPQVNSASPVRLLRRKELYFLLQHRGSVVHKAKLVGRCGSWTILC